MSTSFDNAGIRHPYVEQEAQVQGGRPIIRGTRFPVSSIVQNHRRGLSVDEILREFPHLLPAQVYDALSYYYDHQAEIDEEIAVQRDVAAAQERHPQTFQP